MKRNWWYSSLFLIFVTILSIVILIPTFFDTSQSVYPVKSKIGLGLDLKGGLYILLGIDFNNVFRDEINSMGRQMVEYLKGEGITATLGTLDLSHADDPSLSIKIDGNISKAREKIKSYYSGVVRLTADREGELRYALLKSYRDSIKNSALSKSIEVIRNRIDQFGVAEPEIFSQGNDRIVVQLPGIDDVDRAKELIGRTAKLEFKIVSNALSEQQLKELIKKAEGSGIKYSSDQNFSSYLNRLNSFLAKDLPPNQQIAFQKEGSHKIDSSDNLKVSLVEKESNLTGDDLETAYVSTDPQRNQPIVALSFKPNGAKKFEEITANNVRKQMAIILDGNIYSAPTINEKIAGGRASITLGFGSYEKIQKEAADLALVLRAGALPVSLDFLEQRIVGPTLGMDSIYKTSIASLIGFAMIIIFALLYYRFMGFIAIITLALNAIFILAILILFGATLTLPGIAGIALTMGMAIDANIIIYERIKEELAAGMSVYQAVESGFSAAFWTIVDANLTTAVAGICLLTFGTGPIRGFAVTLIIGIICTVYTTYFGAKVMVDLYTHLNKGQKISI